MQDVFCTLVRQRIIEQGYKSGRGHISSALSLVEILAAVYRYSGLDLEKIKNKDEQRTRVILSKGHGALALYATLIESGVVSEECLRGFATSDGIVSTHPVKGSINGIEMTAGSLGQGVGYATGNALGAKIRGEAIESIVIVGDGELQEGSNWEALLFAAHHKLDNLTIIIDKNHLQISDAVEHIVRIDPLRDKFASFGFGVCEVDGHCISEIVDALKTPCCGMPKVIIADTIKGKGVSFIENKGGWHGKGLTYEQYVCANKELECI